MPVVKEQIQKRSNARNHSRSNERIGGLLIGSDRAEYTYAEAEKIAFIKSGISRNQLDAFKNTIGLNYDQLADALAISRATFFKRKEKEKYSIATSERVFLLADVYSYGYAVFNSKEKFNHWMETDNTALGHRRPIDLLETIYGIFEVKNLIGRIAYGVFS